MSINQALLPEYDHEIATTRRALERVPDDALGWAPHEKSMTLGKLANHIATLPMWLSMTLGHDSLDMNPPDGQRMEMPNYGSRKELVEAFDKLAAEARQALATTTDGVLMSNWSLLNGGQTIFTMPKVAVLRSFVMNHLIHHRGQLSVYLRLRDVPVPSIYGPSADEGGM